MLNNEDYLNIFHEIKNSITVVNGSLQLVAKKHPEVCGFDYWNDVISEITSLKNMVTQFSSVRLCSCLNLTPVDIYSFMEQLSGSFYALSLNDFHHDISIAPNLPCIEIDPQLLRHALINLLKNAYEATNNTKPVHIRIFMENGLLHIDIIDNGGGLDPAIADDIFQPFITTKTGGSGLGLVITRQIIESHNGTLSCDSRPGDGCTFTIMLPVMQN